MSRHETAALPRVPWRRPLQAAILLAWLPTAALLARGLLSHSPAVAVGVTGLFVVGYALLAWRRRPRAGADPWRAAPLLAFAAPLGELVGLLLDPARRATPPFASELAVTLGAVAAAFGALLLLERVGDQRRPRLVAWGVGGWLALVWFGSLAQQVARMQLLQPLGHPEDTAFLWDCFRNWAAGGPLLSPWMDAWGHHDLRSYFGLHFSPIVLPVFALVKAWPRVETLFVIQGLFIAGGLAYWARVTARQARQGRSASGTPVALWFLALLAASPPLSAMLRGELHPLTWSLPALAWLHDAWWRRRRLRFLLAAASLFLFREDLGLVLAAYAPLAWLDGRRGRRDLFWLLVPLAGLPVTAALMFAVMPRWGLPDPSFFHRVFGTTADGFVPFLLALLTQPAELLGRLLRPGHLLLALRLALTGVGVPWRSWLWLPGLPLTLLFALVARDTQLLRLDSHYEAVPAFYLIGAGLVSLWTWLRDLSPRRREVAFILLWAAAAAQPARLLIPDPAALRHPARHRAEVLSDLQSLQVADKVWVPVEVMIAAPPDRAVPAHRLVLETLDPTRPGLPGWALLRSGPVDATDMGRQLLKHYRIDAPAVTGRYFDLYRLEVR
ncbi:MAG: DUF2079 domain-containing protein [Candidatus Krumholzibacteriia bacterium]